MLKIISIVDIPTIDSILGLFCLLLHDSMINDFSPG